MKINELINQSLSIICYNRLSYNKVNIRQSQWKCKVIFKDEISIQGMAAAMIHS